MTSQVADQVDPKALRNALGNFATGVTVITACTPDGDKAGVTANSFNSVSLEPPLVLWSIMKTSSSVAIFENASHFAVNVLAADQINLSNHFARPSDDKFATIDYEQGAGNSPLLPECSARFQCEYSERVDGGDHWILIGKVVAFDDIGRAPLLYHGGAYSAVIPHAGVSPKDGNRNSSSEQNNTHRLHDNLFYQMIQALKRYQNSYHPIQQATGLRTIEARMLMTLTDFDSLPIRELEDRIAMPDQDLHASLEHLTRKEWVRIQHEEERERLSLTDAGHQQAEVLWRVSAERQQQVFGAFSPDELATCRRVLEAIQ